MESLYVCLFSNGHIKVGRSYSTEDRIAAHVDRVACLGVKLIDSRTFPCDESAPFREARLIQACCAAATQRHQNEWFTGLDFSAVCRWALDASSAPVALRSVRGHLRDYLQSPGALTVPQLRAAMNELGADLRDEAQLRQWIAVDAEGNFKRQPGAAYAMYLERATQGRVTRQAMRPDDYAAIWPELQTPKARKQPAKA